MIRSMLLIMLTAAVCSPARAATFVVTPEGTGDFTTIQEAIDASASGDVIELTDGVFTGTGNRDLDVLGKAITIRSQGGAPGACTIDIQGTPGAPHRGFWFHASTGAQELAFHGVNASGTLVLGEIRDASSGGYIMSMFFNNKYQIP